MKSELTFLKLEKTLNCFSKFPCTDESSENGGVEYLLKYELRFLLNKYFEIILAFYVAFSLSWFELIYKS